MCARAHPLSISVARELNGWMDAMALCRCCTTVPTCGYRPRLEGRTFPSRSYASIESASHVSSLHCKPCFCFCVCCCRAQTQATGRLSVAPACRPSDPLCLPPGDTVSRADREARGPRGPIQRSSPTYIAPGRANGTSRGGAGVDTARHVRGTDGHIAAQSRLDSPSIPQCLVSSLLGQSIVSGCCELYSKSASCDGSSISVRGGPGETAQQSEQHFSDGSLVAARVSSCRGVGHRAEST